MQIKSVRIFSGFSYAEPVARKLIQDLKYCGRISAEPALEKLIKRWAFVSGHLIPENCVLVPVPLHPSKQRIRGFNQAEILARIIGRTLDIPVVTNFLIRSRNDISQTESINRNKNVEGAFGVRGIIYEDVFLIDDVLTSGSTMRSCITVLQKNQISCVGGFALAWGRAEGNNTYKKPGF